MWLARLGIPPWKMPPLTESECFRQAWEYFDNKKENNHWQEFIEHGRIALCYENQRDAWSLALEIGLFLYGKKMVILSSDEQQTNYRSLYQEAKANLSGTKNFHWKVVKQAEDLIGIPWDELSYLIVDGSESLPDECLEAIYGYKGRLVLIAPDPLMDLLEDNWTASLTFGLVARLLIYPGLAFLRSNFGYNSANDHLIAAILRNWREAEGSGKALI